MYNLCHSLGLSHFCNYISYVISSLCSFAIYYVDGKIQIREHSRCGLLQRGSEFPRTEDKQLVHKVLDGRLSQLHCSSGCYVCCFWRIQPWLLLWILRGTNDLWYYAMTRYLFTHKVRQTQLLAFLSKNRRSL